MHPGILVIAVVFAFHPPHIQKYSYEFLARSSSRAPPTTTLRPNGDGASTAWCPAPYRASCPALGAHRRTSHPRPPPLPPLLPRPGDRPKLAIPAHSGEKALPGQRPVAAQQRAHLHQPAAFCPRSLRNTLQRLNGSVDSWSECWSGGTTSTTIYIIRRR